MPNSRPTQGSPSQEQRAKGANTRYIIKKLLSFFKVERVLEPPTPFVFLQLPHDACRIAHLHASSWQWMTFWSSVVCYRKWSSVPGASCPHVADRSRVTRLRSLRILLFFLVRDMFSGAPLFIATYFLLAFHFISFIGFLNYIIWICLNDGFSSPL